MFGFYHKGKYQGMLEPDQVKYMFAEFDLTELYETGKIRLSETIELEKIEITEKFTIKEMS